MEDTGRGRRHKEPQTRRQVTTGKAGLQYRQPHLLMMETAAMQEIIQEAGEAECNGPPTRRRPRIRCGAVLVVVVLLSFVMLCNFYLLLIY